jgi:starch phosphorylase
MWELMKSYLGTDKQSI